MPARFAFAAITVWPGAAIPTGSARRIRSTEKLIFQVVHALHTTGRCTECGRACPMGIPVLKLKRHRNQIIHDLFEYRAGTDSEAVPPLLSFQAEEKNINERGW